MNRSREARQARLGLGSFALWFGSAARLRIGCIRENRLSRETRCLSRLSELRGQRRPFFGAPNDELKFIKRKKRDTYETDPREGTVDCDWQRFLHHIEQGTHLPVSSDEAGPPERWNHDAIELRAEQTVLIKQSSEIVPRSRELAGLPDELKQPASGNGRYWIWRVGEHLQAESVHAIRSLALVVGIGEPIARDQKGTITTDDPEGLTKRRPSRTTGEVWIDHVREDVTIDRAPTSPRRGADVEALHQALLS
jgi:hypothetical protein